MAGTFPLAVKIRDALEPLFALTTREGRNEKTAKLFPLAIADSDKTDLTGGAVSSTAWLRELEVTDVLCLPLR